MHFRPKLMQRFFLTLLIIISMIFVTVYFYSVPVIQKKVFEIERNASHIAINSVFSLAGKMYSDTEKYRSQALDSHKKRLQSVVRLTESYIASSFSDADRNGQSEALTRQAIFEKIRDLKYGENDYIWISDYNGVLLSHPDPRYHGKDASSLFNFEGQAAIPALVDLALNQGEGFYQYQWNRLNAESPLDKVSFVKNYPQWGFIIGSGIYLNDLKADIDQIRTEALDELREGIKDIKIASTGYLFVFDGNKNMLIHPNSNIDGTNFLGLTNPVTGREIADELIQVADTGKELYYKWDRPNDPGNYKYEKLSLVRYLPGFDWYICSTVYVDELRSSSELLTERIITIAAIALLVALLLMLLFSQWITQPIKRLADTAVRISAGELTAKSGIRRDDEVGLLANTFDTMVERLRDSIQNLDSKVEQRTHALAEKNQQLIIASESMASTKEALSHAEQRQRLILDALPAFITYLDTHFNILFVNQGFANILQQDKASIINQPLRQVIGESTFSLFASPLNEALQGKQSTSEYTEPSNDTDHSSKSKVRKRIVIPCFNPDQDVNGILIMTFDITAEKDAERQLNEAQRMNAVGQMSGGLAHDFNNLLTIILGNLYSVGDRYSKEEELQRYLEPAIRATRRGADITSRLLAFSRRQPLSPTLFDLDKLLHDTTELLSNSLPDHINIHIDNNSSDLQPFVDPGRLEDALVNLAFNARDAMPEGGDLSFNSRTVEIESILVMDETVLPGTYCEICITDTGSGFSDQALIQCFEPFFTSKRNGAGSGLGLSMVYGFVKQSKGYISIQNAHNKGATITLLLPAKEAETMPVTVAETKPEPSQEQAGRLVCLVEDDPDVRSVVRQQLIDLGFDVIDTHSADEAQRLIPLLPELYGLVSDVMLPGTMNGIELADWLHSENNLCRIILMSGYSYQQSGGKPINPAFPLLNKPFGLTELKQALHDS
ncbi:cache domain-containing protein [Amphritea japonica]|uniref:histidine kinase n=1 Tax=Amphritea japonica ATCC BAA-1530 TaxID=1278309 RepID=A0A7R6PDK1_9GAMM|nr:cache domain-containing protein [Amphritea japonica]BBB27096.1 two-component system sensor histidine kinase and response regulator [Amphritea japonica ATCC BAA-1530]